jgi:hypothetical protein
MWRKLSILAAAVAIFAPSVSLANDDLLSGLWRVSGRVATFNFHETCRLERHGDQLGGACVEGQNGNAHPLTGGSIDGEKITWTHKGHFLLKTFNVVYSAVLHDGAMQGELNAAGHAGAFTAAKI